MILYKLDCVSITIGITLCVCEICNQKNVAFVTHAPHTTPHTQGYVVRISGGNDKQGFPMKQGVLTNGRVKLLLKKGHSCYRPRRTGERKRKSVRGCIVDSNLSVLNLVIVKKGGYTILLIIRESLGLTILICFSCL